MPEASVIRRWRALSGFTGRKAFRRRFDKFLVKSSGLTGELLEKLSDLTFGGKTGIHGGAVKCVDIVKNTKGEGRSLAKW